MIWLLYILDGSDKHASALSSPTVSLMGSISSFFCDGLVVYIYIEKGRPILEYGNGNRVCTGEEDEEW